MSTPNELLRQQISEQIALEEQLYKIIEQQISEIDEDKFADAKALLHKTYQALERHFIPLNELLDELEQNVIGERTLALSSNGGDLIISPEQQREIRRISTILRDDYSALNRITISNTLLHTTALALDSQAIASTALKHLENLAPLVLRLGDLMPEIVARELLSNSYIFDPTIAQTAQRNAQMAWRRAS